MSKRDVNAIVADLRAKGVNDPRNRIRGWLLVFVIHVVLLTMLEVFNAALLLLGATSGARVAMGLISAGVAIYGAYCSRLLTSHSPAAPRHAQRLTIVYAGSAIAQAVLCWLDSGEVLRGAGRALLFAMVWFPYLVKSKRVATVYAVRDRAPLLRVRKAE